MSSATAGPRRQPTVAIIGAGMSGICMGIKLQQAGIDDFTDLREAPTSSAARGARTATPASSATSRRASTSSPSRPTRAGRTASRPGPRSGATSTGSPASTACVRGSGSGPRSWTRAHDDGRWRLRTAAGEDRRGRLPDLGHRRPAPPAATRDRGTRLLRGRQLPLGALGPRRPARRPPGRRHRHRLDRRADRRRARRRRRAPGRSSSAPRSGSCRWRTSLHAGSAGALLAARPSLDRLLAYAGTR